MSAYRNVGRPNRCSLGAHAFYQFEKFVTEGGTFKRSISYPVKPVDQRATTKIEPSINGLHLAEIWRLESLEM
jgi:hypothetical protein